MPGELVHDVDGQDSDEEEELESSLEKIVPKSMEGWIDLGGQFHLGRLRTRCRRPRNFPNG